MTSLAVILSGKLKSICFSINTFMQSLCISYDLPFLFHLKDFIIEKR